MSRDAVPLPGQGLGSKKTADGHQNYPVGGFESRYPLSIGWWLLEGEPSGES